jgi:hypothetical protein
MFLQKTHFGDSVKTNWRHQEIFQSCLAASICFETSPGFQAHNKRSIMSALLTSNKKSILQLEQFQIRSTLQNFIDRTEREHILGWYTSHQCPVEP